MTSPILWRNSDDTVCLMDVPRSISAAQGTAECPCSDALLSCEAVSSPFASNEPKSAAAKAKLQNNTVEETLHAEYSIILQRAIEQVRQGHQDPWCLPRTFITTPDRPKRKRKRERDENGTGLETPPHPNLPELPDDVSFYANDSATTEDFCVAPKSAVGVESTYRIPPYSTFSLSDCSSSTSFLNSIRSQAQDNSTRRHFDLMIFDPPWPNRSVKRSHKTPGSTYATSTTLDDVFQLVLGTDLDMLMGNDCIVAFWITNKPAVRELVTGEGGIFETWGIELEEEWIWLKTTVDGEPVSVVDSLWRKPYEILLLGRKRPSAPKGGVIKRRTIIAVPDLHSRKPCLRSLLEPMMPNSRNYRALEVFARHLVSGWWSWGTECIKFNYSKFWCPDVEATNENHDDVPTHQQCK